MRKQKITKKKINIRRKVEAKTEGIKTMESI